MAESTPQPCSIPRCTTNVYLDGMCRSHYIRRAVTGDALPIDRFWKLVDKTDPCGCWIWIGTITGAGYGQFKVSGARYQAHRWAYEHFIGPIPEGLVIDHVWERGCRHRRCVNPDHLEAVTFNENLRRAPARRRHLNDATHGH